ncbi:MAG: aldehyde dehydrogenase [Candidatus Competibacteraceae bacterium]
MAIEYDVISPVTGKTIRRIPLATKADIADSLIALNSRNEPLVVNTVFEFLRRLADQIELQRNLFLEAIYLETGFIVSDSMEMIDEAIEFLDNFEKYVIGLLKDNKRLNIIPHSYSETIERAMRIMQQPARCIAAVLPQNAAFTLGIIIIASALYAGSRVILRPPLQSGSSSALLARTIEQSDPPPARIAFVHSLAEDFLEVCYLSDEVDLIHYIGSSHYAPGILARAFAAGKQCLIDGQGNGMLYVDETFSREEAVRIITTAATRFNGETCTSVNGVLIEDTIYKDLKAALIESFQQLRLGHPLEPGIQVGPLFSRQLAAQLEKTIRGTKMAKVLYGNQFTDAYFVPTVIEDVNPNDNIVCNGLFGPAIWIAPIAAGDDLWHWLGSNRFPLSDTLLSTDENLIDAFLQNSRASRICINVDQAIESMFEPWGGYPPGGLNTVSNWIEKYYRIFVIDGNSNDIIRMKPGYIG